MLQRSSRVIVVDDDTSVRTAMRRLFASNGFDVLTYDSGRRLLESRLDENCKACLVLDIRLPDANGLELQMEMRSRYPMMPIIFITGYGDIPVCVAAMKQGAIDFLTKPVEDKILLDAVNEAFRKIAETRAASEQSREMRKRVESLTLREHEVLQHVISGLLNKQIGHELGISEKTVKVHRARVMEKLGACSAADLVRRAGTAGIAPVEIADQYR